MRMPRRALLPIPFSRSWVISYGICAGRTTSTHAIHVPDGGFSSAGGRSKRFRRGGSSVKSAIYPRSRHEFEAHSPLHHLDSVQRPELERRVVGGQAERGAAVGRGGGAGVGTEAQST